MSEMSLEEISEMKREISEKINDEKKSLKRGTDADIHRRVWVETGRKPVNPQDKELYARHEYYRNELYILLSDYCREMSDQICEQYNGLPDSMRGFKLNSKENNT